MNGWTEEKRQAARDRIYQNQPWLKSTGARTLQGKAISSQNACKGGSNLRVRELFKDINFWFIQQKLEIAQMKRDFEESKKVT